MNATALTCRADLSRIAAHTNKQFLDIDVYQDFLCTVCAHVICTCSGSVVVTAYDFESCRLGSNPESGPIYYEASITVQGLPKPSSLRGSTSVPEQLNNWGMQID